MHATELTHRFGEQLRLLKVAEVAGSGDHDELGVRKRLLELACDAERRAHVELASDQQGRDCDVGQQVALVGLGHHGQLRPETLRADVGSHRLE